MTKQTIGNNKQYHLKLLEEVNKKSSNNQFSENILYITILVLN